MDVVIKLAAVALVAALCTLLIKSKNSEQAFLLGTASAVIICLAAMKFLGDIVDFVKELIALSNVSSAVFMPVIKCIGIAIVSKLVCELCKDAGQAGIASAVEYTGAVAAVYISLPLLETILDLLVNMA